MLAKSYCFDFASGAIPYFSRKLRDRKVRELSGIVPCRLRSKIARGEGPGSRLEICTHAIVGATGRLGREEKIGRLGREK